MDRDQLDISDTAQGIVNAKASARLLLNYAASQKQIHVLRTLIRTAYLEGFENGAAWQEANLEGFSPSRDSELAGAAMWAKSETFSAIGSPS